MIDHPTKIEGTDGVLVFDEWGIPQIGEEVDASLPHLCRLRVLVDVDDVLGHPMRHDICYTGESSTEGQ